jgi:TRAP-type transport system periplasmic protein
MRKLTVLIMAFFIVFILILSSCTQPSTPPPASSGAAPSAPAAATTQATGKDSPSAPAAAASPAASLKPIELRFSHQNPPTAYTTLQMLNPFGKKIEEASKGRLKVTMYPAESLAKSAENLQAVTSGLADIAWLNLGNFIGKFPVTEVGNLPFLSLPDTKYQGKLMSSAAVNSRVFMELFGTNKDLQGEFSDVKVLVVNTSDAHFLATVKKPVRNIGDLKGMKITTYGKYAEQMYKLLGSAATVIPPPDVYDAAQKGVIDGMESNPGIMSTWRIYEVAKYWTDVYTNASLFAIAINKEKFNSFPPDLQQAITGVCGLDGAEFAGEYSAGFGTWDSWNAAMQKSGKNMEKIPLDAGQFEVMQKASQPAWDTWITNVKSKGVDGQKIIDAIIRLQAKYKS